MPHLFFKKMILTIWIWNMYSLLHGQESIRINENLDNATILKANEDVGLLKKGKVYSIYRYQLSDPNRLLKKTKYFKGKKFNLLSYTEYLPDGRKRYKEYEYDQIDRTEKYHYDEDLKKLRLLEQRQDNKKTVYHWLFYDKDQILSEEVHYNIIGNNEFNYEGYTQYTKKVNGKEKTITIHNFYMDTLPEPLEIYQFNYPILIKETPLFQSKKTTYQMINGQYMPIAINSYVIDGRDVTFSYDLKGRISSEVWHRSNALENKKEYHYSEDGTEKIEQEYHMLGREKSTKTTKRFDKKGNLVFEQPIEYNGNPLGIYTFEYNYDKNGNWTEKKTYYQPINNGIPANRELKNIEIREIRYYTEINIPRQFQLPQFPEKAQDIRIGIPIQAKIKQKRLNEFYQVVENGKYEGEIGKINASTIDDFTPAYWKQVKLVYGNLDAEPDLEALAVYETPILTELGYKHSLAVFKKTANGWELWHQTTDSGWRDNEQPF